MENYIKASLRVYPYIDSMQEAYAQHIRTKAIMSCDGRTNTEDLAEYLAEQILHKRRLARLKSIVDGALKKLSDPERELVKIIFFQEKRREEWFTALWSARKRLYIQDRVFGKFQAILKNSGLTRSYFDGELLKVELVRKMYKRTLFEAERNREMKGRECGG